MKICFFGAYDRNYTSNQIVLKGLEQNNVKVVEVNSHTPLTRLDSEKDMSTFKLISRILKKRKIVTEIVKHWKDLRTCDYIYVAFPGHFDVILAYPLAKLLRKKILFNPIVIFYTGFVNDQGILKDGSILANILKLGEKMIYGMSDIILADTQLQKDHIHSLFGTSNDKIKVLALGADDSIYKYSFKKPTKREFNVVYYGLYSPLHGVEYILDAAELCLKDKSIKFLMVGKGNTYEKTVADAKKRKLTNVIFYPDLTEVDSYETLASADVFIGFLQKHPTVDRIVPNKVYQGFALGKTVVTGETPVMNELFEHKKHVYFCKLADGKSLANAVLELRSNEKLQTDIAKDGYKIFMDKFTPRQIGKQFINLMSKSQAN